MTERVFSGEYNEVIKIIETKNFDDIEQTILNSKIIALLKHYIKEKHQDITRPLLRETGIEALWI